MLLRNYDNIVAAYSLVSYQELQNGDTTVFGDGHLNVKWANGNIHYIKSVGDVYCILPLNRLCASRVANQGHSWVSLGSGTTPVNYDDYKLENELSTSQIVVNSSSRVIGDPIYDEINKTWTKTMSYDFQAKSDVTVSEIGVYFQTESTNSGINLYALVYREVLEQPVSLTTGQYLKVSITTTVSANPNKPADVSATVETV